MKKKLTFEVPQSVAEDFIQKKFRSAEFEIAENQLATAIREQLASSYRELRVKVLRGEYEPCFPYGYMYVDKDGTIHAIPQSPASVTEYNTYLGVRKRNGFLFAPDPALAEELSAVIQGRYRPTQEDIDAKVLFWRYSSSDVHVPSVDVAAPIETNPDWYEEEKRCNWRYFFTESQRVNFIAQQKPKEPEKEKCLQNLRHAIEQVEKDQYFNALCVIGDATRNATSALQKLINQ